MDAAAEHRIAFETLNVFDAYRGKHLNSVALHIFAHLELVVPQHSVDSRNVQTPFVFPGLVERHFVLMIGQGLAEASYPEGPVAGSDSASLRSEPMLSSAMLRSQPSRPAP